MEGLFSPSLKRPSGARPPRVPLYSPGLLPGSSSAAVAAVPLKHSSAATATTATKNPLNDWNTLYSNDPMPIPNSSTAAATPQRRLPQRRTYSPKAMALPLNRRKFILEGMNNNPGTSFLHVKRSSIPSSAMVTLPPPGERDPPRPYPIKTYYTHPHSEVLIGTRPRYTDEGYEYREIPQFPHAIFEVDRTFVPNMFYTIGSTENGAFPYTLDKLLAIEQKRLASINRARGGKRRRSRHPKKSHKRTTRRRL
jgi:hypothetical protein